MADAPDLFGEGDSRRETNANLDVFVGQFLGRESRTWEALVEGFTHFRGITFSSSVSAILAVVDRFETAEIVFGSERILSREHAALEGASTALEGYTFRDAVADQKALVETLSKYLGRRARHLLERVEDGSLRFRLLRKMPSHEKLYLLSGPDGYRVIAGSANLSLAALRGQQREIFVRYDGREAYNAFLELFDREAGEAAPIEPDQIVTRDARGAEDATADGAAPAPSPEAGAREASLPMEDVPVVRTLKAGTVIQEETTRRADIPEISETALRQAARIGREVAQVPMEKGKGGKTIISADTFLRAWRTHKSRPVQGGEEEHLPALDIDTTHGAIDVDGTPWFTGDAPEAAAVRRDVELLGTYIESFSGFSGDVAGALEAYWTLLVWMYAAPFCGLLRQQADLHNSNPNGYPVFAVTYGRSDGGKTMFSRIVARSMFGIEKMLRGKDFTPTRVDGLRYSMRGIPLLADDVNRDKFNRAVPDLVKRESDATGAVSPVLVSTNQDVKAVRPEVRKRMIVAHIDAARLPSVDERPARLALSNMDTALYRAFLARFMPMLSDMFTGIADDPMDPPDLFAAASEALVTTLEAHGGTAPWARPISRDTVDRMKDKRSLDVLYDLMEHEPERITVDRSRNELVVRFEDDKSHAAAFESMVPSWACKGRIADAVRMDLGALEDELGFGAPDRGRKPRLFRWLFGRR